MKKKLLSMLLATVMVASLCSCGTVDTVEKNAIEKNTEEKKTEEKNTEEKETVKKENDDPTYREPDLSVIGDWLHPGEYPLVSEDVEKSLWLAIRQANAGLPAEERYMYKFIENTVNIDLEPIDFLGGEERGTFISLTFADGKNMPDAFIGFKFTTEELTKYGAVEKQLVDLAPFITPELMPNLCALYEKYPEYKELITDSEGHIWSLGYISNPGHKSEVNRMFWNYEWLEELNLEVPRTVDEFINVLRAFKTKGDDIVPMGGSYNLFDPTGILLHAYGYVTDDVTGFSIASRNGEVVLPVADREVYGEFIKTMNTLYTEGLIDDDFYTMSGDETRAVIAEGKTGFIAQAPSLFLAQEDTRDWWASYPLTSEYCEEPLWPSKSSAVGIGNVVVTTACEDVELLMAFCDSFYDENSLAYHRAARGSGAHETDYLYEGDWFGGTYYDEEKKEVVAYDNSENPAVDAGSYNWRCANVMLWNTGVVGYANPDTTALQILTNQIGNETLNLCPPDRLGSENYNELRHTLPYSELYQAAMEVPVQYIEYCLPYAFLDAEISEEATNILVNLKNYAVQEIAKFVTGLKPLDELNDYFDEMEALGADRYVEIYKEYYGK